jgi:hypothetical protein
LSLPLAAALLFAAGCSGGGDNPAPRVIVFGIDGADWDRALPLVRQGKLPAMKRILRTGSRRTLVSLIPERLSPTIWTTAATGVLPERHGIHHFVTRGEDGSIQPVTSNQRRVAAAWNILSARDRTVGVYGWLATWPAEPVNGVMISSYTPFFAGWSGDKASRPLKGTFVEGIRDQVWPPGLQEELSALKTRPDSIGDHELAARFTGVPLPRAPSPDAARSLEGMRWSWASDRTYERIYHHLADRSQPAERADVEFLYFGSVDVVGHRFWKYMEPDTYALGKVDPAEVAAYGLSIESAYRSVDDILTGVLAREEEPTRLFILSDHGFRENRDPARATSSGWHRSSGILLSDGPGLREGLLPPASVVDFTPTLLYASGLPVATDMDGSPALDLFEEEHLFGHPVQEIPSWEPEVDRERGGAPVASPVDAEIVSRLRALGYLD